MKYNNEKKEKLSKYNIFAKTIFEEIMIPLEYLIL
jgi:hypothetical protein